MKNLTKIAIHGVPRSGTSWLGEIFNSSPNTIYKFQPLFSYALKDFLCPQSSKEDIDKFFELLSGHTADDFIDQKEKREKHVLPSFSQRTPTHLVYKEVRYHHILANLLQKTSDLLLIAIVRDPLAVINSWLNAPREFRADQGWKASEEWRFAPKKNQDKPEEFNGYEKWKEATNIFLKLSKDFPDRAYLVRYEDLATSPLLETEKLFSFCKIPLTDQTRNFILESQSKNNPDTYSVFRNSENIKFRDYNLDQSIIDFIKNDLTGSALERFIQQV